MGGGKPVEFASFILHAEDLDAMAVWYRDVVGLKQNFDSEGFIAENGFFFNMVKRRKTAGIHYPKGINDTMSVGFSVTDHEKVDIEYERLIKGGAKAFVPPKTEGIFREAYVTDPEGNIIYIVAVKE